MKVKELIEELQTSDPELSIVVDVGGVVIISGIKKVKDETGDDLLLLDWQPSTIHQVG
jgi:hypothetical protein